LDSKIVGFSTPNFFDSLPRFFSLGSQANSSYRTAAGPPVFGFISFSAALGQLGATTSGLLKNFYVPTVSKSIQPILRHAHGATHRTYRHADLGERHLHVEHGEDGRLAGAELAQRPPLEPHDGFPRKTAMGGDIALAKPEKALRLAATASQNSGRLCMSEICITVWRISSNV
jgi:hypothetical protein